MGRYRKDSSLEPAEQQDDGQVLWEKVAKTVKKRNRQLSPKSAKQKTKVKSQSDNFQSVNSVTKKTRTIPAAVELADFRIGETSGIDRSSARRLQRGQFRIEDRLDLHGSSQQQAHKQLISFISRAVQQNFRHVLVITGKGREGYGILRQQVPTWLKDLPLRQYINAISYAQPQDGGTGALYIRLKRQRGDIK
tara:strand:+ start:102 stop:680 length:579 start_codon:yes stop_codon:yes gene_type:complete